jgi:hypothetical protein
MDDVDWNNFFTNPVSANYLDQQFASVDTIPSLNIDDLQDDIHIFNKFTMIYSNIQKKIQDIEIKYLRALAEKKEFDKEQNILEDRNIDSILYKLFKYTNPVESKKLLDFFNENRTEMNTKLAFKNQEIINKINKILDDKSKLEILLNRLKELIKTGCETIDFDELQSTKAVIKNLECPICTTTQVDCIVSDCGHTFCQTCIGKTNTCPMCNTHKTSIQRIFFSS